MFDWQFMLLLVSNGVMLGLMYALIALGFVLVYKATDAINFAQGEFVMIGGFAVAVTMATKLWAFRLAPPTRAPSISGSPASAPAFSGLTLPP